MKLVIDIPEEIYLNVKKDYLYDTEVIVNAFKNGIPLPKGHGRLIDADELKKAYDERITDLYTLSKKDNPSREAKICATNWCNNTIDELPTIIESESEE